MSSLVALGSAGWLVDAENGTFLLDGSATSAVRLKGPRIGPSYQAIQISQDIWVTLKRADGSSGASIHRVDLRNLTVEDLPESGSLTVATYGKLSSEGVLLGTDKGLFRLEAGQRLREFLRPITGAVSVLQMLDDSSWLAGAHYGVYRVDSRGTRADPVPGAETGKVSEIHRLGEGGWLIASERGLFRSDAGARTVTAVAGRKPSRVLEVRKLPNNAWLVRADNGVFIADPDGKKADLVIDEPGFAWKILMVDGPSALLGSDKLLYVFQIGPRRLNLLSGEAGTEFYSTHFVPGAWLASTERGLFKIELAGSKLTAIQGPSVGQISEVYPSAGGGFVLRASQGLFRVDPDFLSVERIAAPSVGEIRAIAPLPDSGLLLAGDLGLARLGANAQPVPLQGSPVPKVSSLRPLAGGGWLASGDRGAVRVDASGDRATRVLGLPEASSLLAEPGPRGGMILGTPNGLLTLSNDLDAAFVAMSVAAPGQNDWWRGASAFMTGSIRHPCAAAAADLRLMVEARSAEGAAKPPRKLPVEALATSGGAAQFSADLSALEPGRWSLQLVADPDHGRTAVGSPVTFQYEPTLLDRARGNGLWVAGALATVHFVVAGVLLLMARSRPRLMRAMLHPFWSKLTLWPSFLLRRSPRLRCRMLAPWFKAKRGSIPGQSAFLDAEIAGPGGRKTSASKILAQIGREGGIWLHGRPGTGKTEVLAAAQRAFFAGHRSLTKAIRGHGYILLPASAPILAAAHSSPSSDTPVFDAVLRGFAETGSRIDRTFLDVLLKNDRTVLLLDDLTEAERSGPLSAFLLRYPKVRVIAASDVRGPAEFDAWELPAALTAERSEALLRLWLGAYSGAQLAARIVREGLQAQLVSVLDLKLVADLVTAAPDAELPDQRVGLWTALLGRATAAGAPESELNNLRSIAWTMTLEGRRILQPGEVATIPAQVGKALVSAGVLRPEGSTFGFVHDLVRLFLAASWLATSRREPRAIRRELEGSLVWSCRSTEQEELWRFLAELLPTDDLPALLPSAAQSAERVHLLAAIYARGCASNLFPRGLSAAKVPLTASLARRRSGPVLLSVPGS